MGTAAGPSACRAGPRWPRSSRSPRRRRRRPRSPRWRSAGRRARRGRRRARSPRGPSGSRAGTRPGRRRSLVGARREGRDGHALDHPEGVRLQHQPVHERAGIAFVRVADDRLRCSGCGPGVFPLLRGRVAGPASSPQPALADQGDHLRRAHALAAAAQGREPARGDVPVDVQGIDACLDSDHATLRCPEGAVGTARQLQRQPAHRPGSSMNRPSSRSAARSVPATTPGARKWRSRMPATSAAVMPA